MMSHVNKSRFTLSVWTVVQLLVWAAAVVFMLLFVTACGPEEEPGKRPKPGPTFIREPAPSCGRCFDRPGLGHATEAAR